MRKVALAKARDCARFDCKGTLRRAFVISNNHRIKGKLHLRFAQAA